MAEDDPQEDLQVVAMTAGAAAARVAETVVRARQNSLQDHDGQQRSRTTPVTPGAAGAEKRDPEVVQARHVADVMHIQQTLERQSNASRSATPEVGYEGRSPEVQQARQVADAMNGRPVSEAARAVSTVQPARQVERIRAREAERSR